MSDNLVNSPPAPAIFGRLGEHFERAMSAGSPLACMLIAIDRLERCSDEAARERLWGALSAFLRAHPDLANAHSERSGDLLWLLVPGRGVKDAVTLARALVDGARNGDAKRARMMRIFEANLALRERVAS